MTFGVYLCMYDYSTMSIKMATSPCSSHLRSITILRQCFALNSSVCKRGADHSISRIEPPFIMCRTPIIRSWNGWGFLIPNIPVASNQSKQTPPTFHSRCINSRIFQKTTLLEKEHHIPLTYISPIPVTAMESDKPHLPENIPPSRNEVDRPTAAQLSFVLLKLRDEIPQFLSGHHSYDSLYENDMIFENKLGHFPITIRGRFMYQLCLMSSHQYIRFIYHKAELDLLKITKDIDFGKIEARWRVRGLPRFLPWLPWRVIVEGFSTFTVNTNGHITKHVMDKVMPSPKDKGWVLSWLTQLRMRLNPRPSVQPETYISYLIRRL